MFSYSDMANSGLRLNHYDEDKRQMCLNSDLRLNIVKLTESVIQPKSLNADTIVQFHVYAFSEVLCQNLMKITRLMMTINENCHLVDLSQLPKTEYTLSVSRFLNDGWRLNDLKSICREPDLECHDLTEEYDVMINSWIHSNDDLKNIVDFNTLKVFIILTLVFGNRTRFSCVRPCKAKSRLFDNLINYVNFENLCLNQITGSEFLMSRYIEFDVK